MTSTAPPLLGITFAGRDRVGRHVTGRLREDESLPAFVERMYRNGWRSLRVYTDSHSGLCGEIFEDSHTGKRLWWSE